MPQLLQSALDRTATLPEADQDAIAALILEELESEERWQPQFAASYDLLAKLAEEAREEHRAGKTRPLDRDTMGVQEHYATRKGRRS